MNKNGRGARGRHWKHGDAGAIGVMVYIHPQDKHFLCKAAKKRHSSLSDEMYQVFDIGRQTGSKEEQLRETRTELQEVKRIATEERQRREAQELLIQEMVGMLRKKGIHLDRQGMRRLVNNARRRLALDDGPSVEAAGRPGAVPAPQVGEAA